jgi:hypothetical protein
MIIIKDNTYDDTDDDNDNEDDYNGNNEMMPKRKWFK